ncbi:MAG TPA: hypothetical protein VKF60_10805 [Myxococcota bacterium]|nr:hypothetical protein [Myxococcota bacterium]
MRFAARIAATALAFAFVAEARADTDVEPNADALFALASEQAFGASAVEVWKSEWDEREITFGVARRWESGRVALVLRVFSPHNYDPLSFLLRPRASGMPSIEYYRSPKLFPIGPKSGRTLDVQVASQLERLPFAPGLPALADLWPARAADYSLARLPDAEVAGRPCRVLEQRLRRADGAYDRIVTSLARDSHLALETRYLRGEKWVRRVTVLPSDVDRTGSRPVARRRSVERPGEATQVLTLERFSLDPVFPDQLFTSSNLRTGRFPSY